MLSLPLKVIAERLMEKHYNYYTVRKICVHANVRAPQKQTEMSNTIIFSEQKLRWLTDNFEFFEISLYYHAQPGIG